MRKFIRIFAIVIAGLSVIVLFIFNFLNIKTKEDLNLINHGMSSEKVIEILGKPITTTTDLDEIKEVTSHTYIVLKDFFAKYDDDYVNALEDTPSKRKSLRRREEHKTVFSNLIKVKEYIEQRENLEMFSYPYKDSEDGEYYVQDIVFHDDEVIYFYILNE